MENKNKFYDKFSSQELKSVPVNFQKLTVFQSEHKIVTSNTMMDSGISIKAYNASLLGSEPHHSPISKMIDFG